MKNLKVPPARIDAETYNKLVDMRKKLSQDTGAYVSESEIVRQALDYYREWRNAGNSAIPRTTAPLEQRLTLVWVDDGLMQFVDQTSIEDLVNRSQVVRDAIAAFLQEKESV